jgi:hypothetical protein
MFKNLYLILVFWVISVHQDEKPLFVFVFWYFWGGGRRLRIVIVEAASPQQPHNPPKQNNQNKCIDLTNNNETLLKK